MTKRPKLFGLLIVLLLIARSALATEITVRKDGTGDFVTIDDAFAAASANDTITVGPGTYAEPFIDVAIPIHLRSEFGPDMTTLDGQGANRFFLFAMNTTVEGFTFAFGRGIVFADAGGAIIVSSGANVAIDNCKFLNNTAGTGGAVYVTQATTVATFTNCSFVSNDAPLIGGAICVVLGAVLNVDRCNFESNSTGVWGGAIHAGAGSTLNVSGSLFDDNVAGDVAGAIYMYRATGTIQTSTFWRNQSPGTISGTLTIQQSPGTTVSRNIIARDTAGFGLYFYMGGGSHNCNVFWNNSKGAIAGGALAVDEVVSNPLFCGALFGNFMLSTVSPATASNSACGLLIGAFDVGCGTVAVREHSWGRMKSLYAPPKATQ